MITTTVGNFPKVAEDAYTTKVIGAISRWQRKELTDSELERVFQEVTKAVIQEQETAGLDLLTDGQVRWEDLLNPIARKLEGFEINGLSRWFDNNIYYRRPILHKAPRWTGPILVRDYQFAAQCTSRPLKAILPGPYTFAKMSEDRYYKSEQKFTRAMAEILHQEAKALEHAGAPFIQFDEPALGFAKPNMALAVEAIGIVTQGLKAKTALYTYFGALNGNLGSLMRAKVDVIGLDLVSSPKTIMNLKHVPIKKTLALGCLDGRNTKLESVTELHALFNVIRKILPLEQIYVNPNTGLEFLPHEQALQKIQRLQEAVVSYGER